MVFITPHILRDDVVTADQTNKAHVTVSEETQKAQQQIVLPDDDVPTNKKK